MSWIRLEIDVFFSALEQAKLDADRQKLKQAKKRDASSSVDLTKAIHFSNIVLPKKASKRIVRIYRRWNGWYAYLCFQNVHDAEIHCIAASSTGTMFATGGADKKIKLLDAKTGNITHSLSGALQTITSVSFNSTDELVLGSCTDNATRIWSLATHRLKVSCL